MKNVFVSGFKKLTGKKKKKKIKSWLRELKSSRSEPVECGRVWPLASDLLKCAARLLQSHCHEIVHHCV